MRFKSTFFLLIFVSFLVTPSVVSLMDSTNDVAVFFSMNEEENSDNNKIDIEKKTIHNNKQSLEGILANLASEKTVQKQAVDWNSVYLEMVSPPPEQRALKS